ncbi:MFS transporter [Pseudonocardia sp. RS010]|uniref:MFS transporter n=1 Tax=Pseudonocardia sp. RS010 TaxID=3385979 RepID=UPI0039A327E1
MAFGLFALATAPAGIIAAAVLTGVAGALFNPAVRSYLSREASEDRAGAFAVFNTAGDAGAFVGPLLGAALLAVDFRLVSAVACGVFALLTIAQLLVLPAREVDTHTDTVLGSWLTVVRNRRFLAFTLCGSGYFALYNQLYLVLPLEAERVTGTPAAVAVLFAVSTLLGVLFFVPIAAWGARRMAPGSCVALGLTLMAVGFVPVALSALLPTATTVEPLPGLVVLGGAVLFTLGIALANPFTMQLIPVVGDERLTGTYYGFFYLVSALVAAGVSAAAGSLLDAGAPAVAAGCVVVVGSVCACGTGWLQRRGALGGARRRTL